MQDELEQRVRIRTRALARSNEALRSEVAERERAEASLRQVQEQFRLFVEHSPAAVAMFDRQMRYVLASRRWRTDYGLGDREIIGRSHYEVFPEVPDRWREIHRRVLAGEVLGCEEDPFPRPDGHTDWVRWECRPWPDASGAVGGLIMCTEVVTERKRAEIRLQRVERARMALSRCSQALVRAVDEPSFLREICRVIVEVAGYRLCWVGFAEHDAGKAVRPVAHAGYEDGYLKTLCVSWDDTDRGRGPVGRAIRSRRPSVFKDVANDPNFAPWREEAMKRGYASVIGVPLLCEAEALGVVVIYASEPDAFDDEEVALLRGLADDLAFGVVSLRARAERRKAREELERAHEELERRVDLRTAELSRANEQLTREVADRERAEQALRSSERLYRQLTEGTGDAIVVADHRGVITLVNPAARRVFGYDEGEALGRPLSLLIPEDHQVDHRGAVRRFVEDREGHLVGRTVELRGRRKGGEVFPLEVSLSAIDLPEGVVLLGAIRDVTDRQRMQARISQAEKLASLGLLSAGIAHEINNPLAYVSNNLAVLERDFAALSEILDVHDQARGDMLRACPDRLSRIDEIAEEFDLPYLRRNLGRLLASTKQGIKRVSDIVQNLRGFTRLDQTAVDRVDLHEAIASSIEMVRGRLAHHNITLEQHWADLPPVSCTPAQINQVVLNLLVNALQAIEATGRDHGRIALSTRQQGDEVVLEVVDDGVGIAESDLPRIFDPFYTTKPIGQGTGLGLSISHGIIRDHGGRLEVDGRPGLGARFRIVLPVARPEPPPEGDPTGPAAPRA
ncbi:GAF domain-containing sensor histidine kinase [Tautonia plasticadhaerens]|uniref:histidine kinase n=1 Tax=Tautonia plasticadhaerens TaxID=2527974 RepID=A0A518H1R0_9BACT|nr:PAS domain S-box protein [Tautonia plasticadhaerens]QDV34778.1 Sensor protein FixL [Tautonia plasticadhaerens]